MRRISLGVAVFVGVAVLFTIPAQAQFGKLGKILDKAKKFSDLEITEADEIELGKAISEKIRTVYGVQQDGEATRYVTLVGMVAAQKGSRPNLPYQFIILDSNVINAFAAPGGYVHITRGALAAMKDEAELSGVLGHEIAHITEKHTLKSLKKMKGIELAEGQTSLTGNSEVFKKVVDNASNAILQGFGRAEELESDRVGVRVAASAGYSPSGLTGFLQTLKAQNESSSEKAGLFASHPETQERIDKLQTQINSEKLGEQSTAMLAERKQQWIKYEVAKPSESETSVEGARGLTGDAKKKEDEDKKKKKGGWRSKLSNPLGKGEKQQSAEVSGAGASRGVGKEGQEEPDGKPKNPALVAVTVTPADIAKFKEEGKLK